MIGTFTTMGDINRGGTIGSDQYRHALFGKHSGDNYLL
jgi:hypothetical protein